MKRWLGFPLVQITLASSIRYKLRERVWLPVHGQHYVFKGIAIHVLEDDDHCRWVSLADVHKVVGATAGERALAAVYPGRLKICVSRIGRIDSSGASVYGGSMP